MYEELRALAASYLRHERPNHTLQPTALVHEAFLRILKAGDIQWRDRGHMVAFAARAMRRILISYAVARNRLKRGGPDTVQLPLDVALDFWNERGFEIAAVDAAIEKLALTDARQAQIVEMRFFAGLTIEEIAGTLNISPATIKRDWAAAKIWLRCELWELEGPGAVRGKVL